MSWELQYFLAEKCYVRRFMKRVFLQNDFSIFRHEKVNRAEVTIINEIELFLDQKHTKELMGRNCMMRDDAFL